MAAHPQAGPESPGRLGRRGPPAERQDRPHERRRQGRPRRPLERPGARRRRPRSTSPARSRRPCPSTSSRCSRPSPSKAFSDPDWLFEIKWDGFRVQAVVADGKVRIWTRNLNDAETYFPRLLSPPRWIDAREAIVDGEVVALDERGPARLLAAPDQARRQDARRASCTRRSTCSTSTGGRCSTSRSRTASGCSRACSRSTRASAIAAHVEGEGEAFYEAAQAQRRRGHRRQAPPLALRAGPRGRTPG